MSSFTRSNRRKPLSIKEIVLFAMLGALMFTSKLILEILPNIHLLAAFTILYTLLFRAKALIPIYVYVFINGVWSGFATWWVPYLYVWTVLWGVVMLLPKNPSRGKAMVIYPLISACHGFFFGVLYSPFQAIMFGLDFKGMLVWIAAGFPWDVVQGIGNLIAGIMVYPLFGILKKHMGKI